MKHTIKLSIQNSIFNADLALSVTMTAMSTILSTAMLPLNVYIYANLSYSSDALSALDWEALAISLAVVVFAISSGIYVSHRFSEGENGNKVRDWANKFGNISGLGLILFTSLAPEGGGISLAGREPIFYYGTILPIALGLLSSVIISTCARLKKPERVTVSIECVYQNTGIAMTACLALFAGDDQTRALGVPFWYTGIQTLFVGTYCLIAWKMGWTKAPVNENFVKLVLHNYQDDDLPVGGDEKDKDVVVAAAAAVDDDAKEEFDNHAFENNVVVPVGMETIELSDSPSTPSPRIKPFGKVENL